MDLSWIITQIAVKDKTLIVFYDKLHYGLFAKFKSDRDIENYIHNHLNSAFNDAVFKKKNSPYFLNIASTENLGAFEWKNEKPLLDYMMGIYMPIIQKFIVDARTDSLEVSLNEETNPQKWMNYISYK